VDPADGGLLLAEEPGVEYAQEAAGVYPASWVPLPTTGMVVYENKYFFTVITLCFLDFLYVLCNSG
jgi:hypothetical protein